MLKTRPLSCIKLSAHRLTDTKHNGFDGFLFFQKKTEPV